MDGKLMHQEQFDRLLAVRHYNGSDYWSTPDKKLGIDKPIDVRGFNLSRIERGERFGR